MCLKTPARHVRPGSSSQGTSERESSSFRDGVGPIPMQLLQSETMSLSELKQYIKRVTGSCASLQLPVWPV